MILIKAVLQVVDVDNKPNDRPFVRLFDCHEELRAYLQEQNQHPYLSMIQKGGAEELSVPNVHPKSDHPLIHRMQLETYWRAVRYLGEVESNRSLAGAKTELCGPTVAMLAHILPIAATTVMTDVLSHRNRLLLEHRLTADYRDEMQRQEARAKLLASVET